MKNFNNSLVYNLVENPRIFNNGGTTVDFFKNVNVECVNTAAKI